MSKLVIDSVLTSRNPHAPLSPPSTSRTEEAANEPCTLNHHVVRRSGGIEDLLSRHGAKKGHVHNPHHAVLINIVENEGRSVWAFGCNDCGQLGRGHKSNHPNSVPET